MEGLACSDDSIPTSDNGFSVHLLHLFKDRQRVYDINKNTAIAVKSELDLNILRTKIARGQAHTTVLGTTFTFEEGKFYCETKDDCIQCAFCPETPCDRAPDRFSITCSVHHAQNEKWEELVSGKAVVTENNEPADDSDELRQSSIPMPDVLEQQEYIIYGEARDHPNFAEPVPSISMKTGPERRKSSYPNNEKEKTKDKKPSTHKPIRKSDTPVLRPSPYSFL